MIVAPCVRQRGPQNNHRLTAAIWQLFRGPDYMFNLDALTDALAELDRLKGK
jgi:hypothetical protein